MNHEADGAVLEAPFCLDDVRQALSPMVNNKAPQADGFPIKLLNYSRPYGRQILLWLFNLIHDRECIPQGGREGALVSAPKLEDLQTALTTRA
jgi:hypothetical protein